MNLLRINLGENPEIMVACKDLNTVKIWLKTSMLKVQILGALFAKFICSLWDNIKVHFLKITRLSTV